MSSTISLSADKKSVKKGDSVTVNWTSELPDSLVLVIEDGDTVQRVQVPDSGSRVCWSNRATKNMEFTLRAATGSKQERARLTVKVHEAGSPFGSANRSGSGSASGNGSAAGIGKFQLWKEKMQARFSVAKSQFQYSWAAKKTWQKVLWIALWVLFFVMLIVAIVK